MNGIPDPDNFTAEGHMLVGGSFEPFTLFVDDGSATLEKGNADNPDIKGFFAWDVVNAHTHCADYGLKIPRGMSLEELVAPPNGLKHIYLRDLGDDGLRKNIKKFSIESQSYGSTTFIDFREGGVEGCRALRECSNDAIVLGRPVSKEYNPEEVASILEIADGIGLPSISDMPLDYIESVADDARSAGKAFAIHASERVREDINFILSLDPTFLVHMCEATDDDMSKCAEAEVPVVVCPTSNAYFGKNTPVKRLINNGVEVGIGTDNGMLCNPDIISETQMLSDLLTRQGGDPSEAWKSLLGSSTKLLNRIIKMECRTSERCLTVIPLPRNEGGDCHRPSRPFRIKMKRGVLNGFQQDSGTHGRKRIYKGRHQSGDGTGEAHGGRDYSPLRSRSNCAH